MPHLRSFYTSFILFLIITKNIICLPTKWNLCISESFIPPHSPFDVSGNDHDWSQINLITNKYLAGIDCSRASTSTAWSYDLKCCYQQRTEYYFIHDDVIKWKHFPRYWPFLRGITGHRWIPRTKASDAKLYVFSDLRLHKRFSKQSWGWWFETPLRSLWRHCNVGFSVARHDWPGAGYCGDQFNPHDFWILYLQDHAGPAHSPCSAHVNGFSWWVKIMPTSCTCYDF